MGLQARDGAETLGSCRCVRASVPLSFCTRSPDMPLGCSPVGVEGRERPGRVKHVHGHLRHDRVDARVGAPRHDPQVPDRLADLPVAPALGRHHLDQPREAVDLLPRKLLRLTKIQQAHLAALQPRTRRGSLTLPLSAVRLGRVWVAAGWRDADADAPA